MVKTFAAGFLGALLACILAFSVSGAFKGSGGSSTVIGGSGSSIDISEDTDRAEAVAQKCLPSVAAIDVYSSNGGTMGMFRQSSDSLVYTGLGSGVVISEDGYIVTNNHVVEGASALKVTVDGQEYEGEVVGTDPTTDLAVVKVDADGLTAIELGDSDQLVAGQWVMALGSPFGLEQSVSTGIVSATSRTITVQDSSDGFGGESSTSVYSQMIQTDAAINPGNSGGALVDSEGRLVGINAVIESSSGNYAGVGFAIPSNYAISIAQQIIDGEEPTHASLGVSCATVTSDVANRYGWSVKEGAYVSAVMEDSGADKAGIREGDIIIAVGDTQIASSTDLVGAIRTYQIGDKVDITLVRNGKTETVSATLGSDGIE
ncbi:MAG: S1C family serine protease [Eggerthellaceae bacterium]